MLLSPRLAGHILTFLLVTTLGSIPEYATALSVLLPPVGGYSGDYDLGIRAGKPIHPCVGQG